LHAAAVLGAARADGKNLRFLRPPRLVRCRLDGTLLPKQQ
jgi:hypothetical protein